MTEVLSLNLGLVLPGLTKKRQNLHEIAPLTQALDKMKPNVRNIASI